MKIIQISDIEQIILLKTEIEKSEDKKYTLEEFVSEYIASKDNIYTYIANHGDDVQSFSILNYNDEMHIFDINITDKDFILGLVDKIINNEIVEKPMETIDINKNYLIKNNKYYEVN